MNNSCFQCSIKEDDECIEQDLERGQSDRKQKKENIRKIEKRLQKMYKSLDDGVLPKYKKTPPTD